MERNASENTNDLQEFVDRINRDAHLPRSKRGGLSQINIAGSAEPLPNSTPDKKYRFRATYFRHCSGQDYQFRRTSLYSTVGDYDKGFNEEEIVRDNLLLIQQRLNRIDKDLRTQIQGKTLVVENYFKMLADLCRAA